jgi:hypothetical protein
MEDTLPRQLGVAQDGLSPAAAGENASFLLLWLLYDNETLRYLKVESKRITGRITALCRCKHRPIDWSKQDLL